MLQWNYKTSADDLCIQMAGFTNQTLELSDDLMNMLTEFQATAYVYPRHLQKFQYDILEDIKEIRLAFSKWS